MSTPIPGPAGWPFLGNLGDIDPEVPIKSLMDIADKYGHYSTITCVVAKRLTTDRTYLQSFNAWKASSDRVVCRADERNL